MAFAERVSVKKQGAKILERQRIRMIPYIAMLTALEIVLSRFLSISLWNVKIGFSFIPVMVTAMLFGPLQAGIVAALADFLGAILFPIGPYFPGFTLTAFLIAFIRGWFIFRHPTPRQIAMGVLVTQITCSLLLNTLWISILYGSPFQALLVTRSIQCLVMIPVEILVTIVIARALLPQLEKAWRIMA